MLDAFQKYLCILKYFMKQLKLWPIEGELNWKLLVAMALTILEKVDLTLSHLGLAVD